jgi:hypothetical protein
MARPAIKACEFGATPQIRLPSSKSKTAIKKTVFRSKIKYAFPQVAWKTAKVKKNMEPYHPT